MMNLFNDIYRIKSLRLSERDYSTPGSYFVTLCTQWQKSYFGKVVEGDVQLNAIGKIVQDAWFEIPYQFEHVELDICMIMPNHVHCILTINESNIVETSIHGVSPKNLHVINQNHWHAENQNQWHAINRVSTDTNKWWFAWNKNSMNNKSSLSYIIRWLKWKTSFLIRKHIPTFKWQANYYEHVVRNERDLERIRTYIMNNPYKRRNDEYYK